jgi:predicted kinase
MASGVSISGSGKTYFATYLDEKLRAVTLNSDTLRLAMFGSLEKIEHIRLTDRPRLYVDMFGIMDCVASHQYDAVKMKMPISGLVG